MKHRSVRRMAMTLVALGLTALGVSAGIPGTVPLSDQVCGFGQTWTSICQGKTTNCTSAGQTCEVCDTSNPITGYQRVCQPQEHSTCKSFVNPSLVNCGPRKTGVCADNGSGGFECSNAVSNGNCLNAGDLCM